MSEFNRREFLALGAIPALIPGLTGLQRTPATAGQPFLCMHEYASNGFDFRTAMEGYSKAGIRAVEVVLAKANEFVAKESTAAARRLLDDLGLKAVSSSNHTGVVEQNPNRSKALDDLKAKCELAQILGADKLVVVPVMTTPPKDEDYTRAIDNLREAGSVAAQYDVSLIIEFSRFFTFVNSLSTAIQLVRAANHPRIRLMLDTYHFWVGVSKFEDLEAIRDGELVHVHFEDTPSAPVRELLEQRHRVLPGEGVAPLKRIVDTLRRKQYAGALSVELMDPAMHAMDPYQLALKVRAAVEPFLA